MANYSYICVLTNEAFYPGLCSLAYSLKLVNSKYPLTVVVPDDVDEKLIILIKKLQLNTIALPSVKIPEEFLLNNTSPRWNQTFFKLQVFNLTQFEKIVFLDLDMIVVRNIDDLFTKPHMAAVAAGHCAHDSWTRLNSGLMVIEPNASLYSQLLQAIPAAGEERFQANYGFGDQDVINFCFPDWWENKELVLPETYNAMVSVFEDVCKAYGYPNVRVLHYATLRKPWNCTAWRMYSRLAFAICKGNINQAKMRYKYWRYVKKSCPDHLKYSWH